MSHSGTSIHLSLVEDTDRAVPVHKGRQKYAYVEDVMRITQIIEFAIRNTLRPSLCVNNSAYDIKGATSKPRPNVKSHQNSTISYVDQV